jgi:hypothetical protein
MSRYASLSGFIGSRVLPPDFLQTPPREDALVVSHSVRKGKECRRKSADTIMSFALLARG